MTRRVTGSLGAALLLAFALALLVPAEPLAVLQAREPALLATVLVELRFPRALLAAVYGLLLGAAGAALQALFQNPLASPDITGTSAGAALGAVLTAYLLGFSSPFAVALGGVAGAGLSLAALLLLAGREGGTATLLLAGVALSALAGALTAFALALAPSPFAFYDAYAWLMGSFVDRSLTQAGFAALPALLATAALLRLAPDHDRLALGPEVAESMGVDLRRLTRTTIVASAFGVGACVAVCGAVGFVGLIAPVIARRLVRGHPGRAMLPAALLGGIVLLLADTAIRFAPPGRTLPVGVFTAVLGAPLFLALAVRARIADR